MRRLSVVDCRGGWILDGVPRTLPQAELLLTLLPSLSYTQIAPSQSLSQSPSQPLSQLPDAVINFTLPTDAIITKLLGRRQCVDCKTTVNIAHYTTGMRRDGNEGLDIDLPPLVDG